MANTTKQALMALMKGDSAFIRYSANADGTDFTEEWSEGQSYIGFATGQTAPTNKNDYEWISLPSGLSDVELPQEWVDINEAYEAIGESGHKLMGGLIYKDFDGNIKVFPLSPAYGVRTDECGEKLAAVAVYNSAQQLMVKPATDGRHTVCLRQLDEFFGGGSTSDLAKGEKAFSLQKIPPVDLTPPVSERKCYVFCRDSQNHFAPKYYGEVADSDTLAERDSAGRLRGNAPDSASNDYGYTDYLVNVDYLNRILNQRLNSYLPLSGGTMTGTHTIKRSNPCLKLNDTSDNTTGYVQLYQGLLRLGYAWQKSLTVDKDGNVEVYGDLTVGTRKFSDLKTENWTFTLEDGSTVTKKVYIE